MILLFLSFLKKIDCNTSVYKKISWFGFWFFSISFIQWIDHKFFINLSVIPVLNLLLQVQPDELGLLDVPHDECLG